MKPHALTAAALPAALLITVGCANVQQTADSLTSSLNEAVSGDPGGSSFPASDPSDACNAEVQALQPDHAYFSQPLVGRAASLHAGKLLNTLPSIANIVIGGGSVNAGEIAKTSAQSFAQDVASASIQEATKDYLEGIGQQNNGNYQQVAYRVNSDAANDSQRLVDVRYKIAQLESCRRRQADDIDRRYHAQQLSAADARAALNDLQTLVRRDNRLIDEIIGSSGQRVVVYSEADQYVVRQTSAPSPTADVAKPKPQKPSKAVKQVKKNHQNAVKEQKKIAKLDQIIESKKGGLPA